MWPNLRWENWGSVLNWFTWIYMFCWWSVNLGSGPAFLRFQASFFHNLDHVSWQISILRLRESIFTMSSFPWCLQYDIKIWLNVSESKHYLLLSNEEDKNKMVFPPQHSVCLIADLQLSISENEWINDGTKITGSLNSLQFPFLETHWLW